MSQSHSQPYPLSSPSNSLPPPLLLAPDYSNWTQYKSSILCTAQVLGLLGHLDGSEKCPKKPEARVAYDYLRKDWDEYVQNDAKAKLMIVGSVPRDVFCRVLAGLGGTSGEEGMGEGVTAQDLWEGLLMDQKSFGEEYRKEIVRELKLSRSEGQWAPGLIKKHGLYDHIKRLVGLQENLEGMGPNSALGDEEFAKILVESVDGSSDCRSRLVAALEQPSTGRGGGGVGRGRPLPIRWHASGSMTRRVIEEVKKIHYGDAY